jgi:trehalose 6-phosphate synthase
MNLVAKEFVAAQNPDDPGVLVLSEFAGAAAEMKAALLVNPHDVDAVAAAISTALEMSRDERIARHREMMETLEANDIRYWARSFIEALTIPQRSDHWLSNWGVTNN